jgi:RNA polymerase sigma factor (TIGR02999 family)
VHNIARAGLRLRYHRRRMSAATRLIDAVGHGDPCAAAELLPLVYDELRQLARARMREERTAHTLQATALVHEAYLRLVQDQPAGWDGRRHFFSAAAEAMRRILIEHARRRATAKQGGGRRRVGIDGDGHSESGDGQDGEPVAAIQAPCDAVDLLALDDALQHLSQIDPPRAELVKLLYFAGLSLDEAAAALGISRSAAYRQWVFTRAWLCDAMTGGAKAGGAGTGAV